MKNKLFCGTVLAVRVATVQAADPTFVLFEYGSPGSPVGARADYHCPQKWGRRETGGAEFQPR